MGLRPKCKNGGSMETNRHWWVEFDLLNLHSGTQFGLVSSYEGHVSGQQWWRRWAEWTTQSTGETGVHNEVGLQPDQSAHRAQRAGECATCLIMVYEYKLYILRKFFFFYKNKKPVLHLNCISCQLMVWYVYI